MELMTNIENGPRAARTAPTPSSWQREAPLATVAPVNPTSEHPHVAVEPACWRRDALVAAVEEAGGTVAPIEQAQSLIWAEPAAAEQLPDYVHDKIDWVQLPYAGIGNFLHLLDNERTWTCGKGVYARPVAEAALAMLLAGFRNLTNYSRATSWSGPVGQNLHGARVLILGGGGITEELLPLLEPFDCDTTVLRRQEARVPGAYRTRTLDVLHDELPVSDAVILALALTPETRHVIGAKELELMKQTAWLVNVARGGHIDTDALVDALSQDAIGGAAIDVTEPEPLPDGHALWDLDNCLITPHVGNTPEMGLALLAERVTDNVARWLAGDELVGGVNLDAGY